MHDDLIIGAHGFVPEGPNLRSLKRREAARLPSVCSEGPGVPNPGPPLLDQMGRMVKMTEGSKKTRTKVARQKLALRESLWPSLDVDKLWDRSKVDGWLSVPRSLPLLMKIMDDLSKGKPVSSVYFDLWCRTYDDSFVIANKTREMAFFSGYTGERAERTWMSRMRILHDLGFIDIQEGPNGPISYVLVYNPYQVVKKHFDDKKINAASFNALKQRMIEIGAHDLDPAEPKKEVLKRTSNTSIRELLDKPLKSSAHEQKKLPRPKTRVVKKSK